MTVKLFIVKAGILLFIAFSLCVSTTQLRAQLVCAQSSVDILQIGDKGDAPAWVTPWDLLHIRYTLPRVPCYLNGQNLKVPALRLDYYNRNYFGQLGLADDEAGTNPSPSALSLSSIATRKDFVLRASSTAEDIILTTQNTEGSIRFVTTPQVGIYSTTYPTTDLAPPGTEKERMTIAANGAVGIGTSFPAQINKLQIHYVDNGLNNPSNSPFPAIKLSINPNEQQKTDNPNTYFYNSMSIALSPCDGCYGQFVKKYDGIVSTSIGDLVFLTNKAENDSWATLNPNTNAGAFRFFTHPTRPGDDKERLTILGNGNVGISQPNPKELLHIGERFTFHSGSAQVIGSNCSYFPAEDKWKRIGDGGAVNMGFWQGNVNISVFSTDLAGTPLINGHSLSWNVNGKYTIGDADVSKQVSENSKLNVSGDIYLGEGNKGNKIRWSESPNDRHWIGYNADSWWMNFTSYENEGFIFRNATDGEIIKVFGSTASYVDENEIYSPKTQIKGRVYIGTKDPGVIPTGSPLAGQPYSLAVNGAIKGKELVIQPSGTWVNWPDYVFKSGYELMPLHEVESYIKEHNRLPEMPSAQEVNADGISVGDMQAKLLKKIEELTLYVIELKKENEEMRSLIVK